MEIDELKRGMNGVSTQGTIADKSEVRRVNTRYGMRSVCDATLKDDTGFIRLSLWEEMIDQVSVGDKVKVEGAYVTEFRGKLQLNIPRSGKLEITEKNVFEL